MSRPTRRPPSLLLQLALFVGLLVVISAHYPLLKGSGWWFTVVAVVTIVSVTLAIAHRVARRRAWPPLAGLIAAIVTLTTFFLSSSALLFVIPWLGTPAAVRALLAEGADSIATQTIPADATPGIMFLFCAGFAAVTIVVDLLAVTFARPALVGIPFVVLVADPSLIDPDLVQPVFFVAVAAVYLVIIVGAEGRRHRARAVTMGAISLVAALVVSLVLPAVTPGDDNGSDFQSYTAGLNPFVDLGADLRRPDPVTALTYTTKDPLSQYITISTLDDFTGAQWEPSLFDDGNDDFSDLGDVPGLDDPAAQTSATVDISIGNIAGRWLPMPYSAVSVAGLDGSWYWDDLSRTARTDSSSLRGQNYTVLVHQPTPTADQLHATGTTVDRAAMSRFLELPSDLPPIVAETANQVVQAADATSNFQKAMALQNYFRGSQFTYSTDAPVELGYDGSSAAVIARFLDVKAGYCVHFSSAMATMARALGIPARIGVGFTDGEQNASATDYEVSTDDLHAWPELYFQGYGWVRFEPTPGRGSLPEFGSISAPVGPDGEQTSSPTPTATPTSGSTPTTAPRDDTGDQSSSAPASRTLTTVLIWIAIALGVIVILLLPAIVRGVRRGRRFMRMRAAPAPADAWAEVRDTALDFQLGAPESETPRAFATRLARELDPAATAALARVLDAVETDVFSSAGGAPAAVDDVRAVRRGVRSNAGRSERGRAALLPASVLARFLRDQGD